MKKIVFLLIGLSLTLSVILGYLIFEKGLVPSLPQISIPKVTPEPTNTMLNELEATGIDKEISGDKKINAEGVVMGGIKQGEIEMTNFKFVPDAISVNQGDTIIITLKNTQGLHDFVIDELEVKSKVLTEGQSEEITFVATKKGTFQFYSSVGNHRAIGMVGTIIVN